MIDDSGGGGPHPADDADERATWRHDLRQPLQALRLLHGALRRAVSDPRVLEMLDAQQEAIDVLAARIDALPGSRTSPAAVGGGPAAAPAGPCVLIVEDDPQIRSAWQRLLAAEGHRPACAASLEELRAVLASGASPQLVVTDYRLAEAEDGVRAIEVVRRATGTSTPALLITGEPEGIGADVYRLENCRIVAKPVRPGVLLGLVREALGTGAAEPAG